MIENHDGLMWEIGETPVQSSTPDDLFEVSYRAKANCQNCGKEISGIANYWSHYENMLGAWLSGVDYKPCDCEDIAVDEFSDDDEEDI